MFSAKEVKKLLIAVSVFSFFLTGNVLAAVEDTCKKTFEVALKSLNESCQSGNDASAAGECDKKQGLLKINAELQTCRESEKKITWSCLRFHSQPPDPDKSPGKKELCDELKTQKAITDEQKARETCNAFCSSGTAGAPYSCYFSVSESCQSLLEKTEDGNRGIDLPFDISELTERTRQLNKLSDTPAMLIGRVIKVAMGIIGAIALIVFITSGVLYMTARGNSQQTEKAIKMMLWGALGTVAILGSYAVVDFLFGAFT